MNNPKSNNEILLTVFHICSLTISYAVFGRLALLLAIPPGYATAIFPSAGIAVAVLLIWGKHLWPGVLLGSVFLNIWISLEQGNLTLTEIEVAVSAGVGASLQALLGAWLVQRTIGFTTTLANERDIILFLLLAGPVACLVNASFGATSLYMTGVIEGSGVLSSWFTWWIGDVFGVWIAAPIVFIAFSQPRQLWLQRRNSIAVPIFIILTAVIFLFVYVSKWEVDREKSEFNEKARKIVYEMRNSFNNYLDVVTSIERFYVSSSDITRNDFHTFVKKSLKSKLAIQGLSWNPLIKNTQRDKFEKSIRKEGFSGFKITERTAEGNFVRAAERNEYVVVAYIEPMAKNASALGFDVASNVERLVALTKARDSGQAVATASITLVQDNNKQAGFLLFQPVYKGLHTTVEARRQNLKGFVVGVFRIGDIVDAVINSHSANEVVVTISDSTAVENTTLYGTDNNAPLNNTRFIWKEFLNVGDRQWSVSVIPSNNYLATFSEWRAWSILAVGCFFISILSAFLLAMTGRSYYIESLVAHRTAELRGILSTAIESIITMDEDGLIESVNPAGEILLDYSSEELLGKPITHFIPEFFNFTEVSPENTNSSGCRGDTYVLRKDTSTITIELAVSTLYLSGRILYTAIIHDLTERIKINRMKDEFISTVSHELRTPLTSIKGAMGLVIGGVLDDDIDKKNNILNVSYENIERLELLINDLLDFNKFQSVENHLKKEKINLNSLIDKAVIANQGYADKFNVSYLWQPSEEYNFYINGDENKLMQVLFNLLSNAVKYSPENYQVVISTSFKDNHVRVSISDSGPGIPFEFQEKVFEQFTQADSSDTRQVGGTGLGLAITKLIIERHDGFIGFNSTPGEGATFYFDMPIAK